MDEYNRTQRSNRYVVEHIQGWRNGQADCLSRLPLDLKNVDGPAVIARNGEGTVATVSDVLGLGADVISHTEWEEEMAKDTILGSVRKLLLQGSRCERSVAMSVRPFVNILDDLSVFGEHVNMRGDRFIPPEGLRFKLFKVAHDGHLGQACTAQRIKTNWWWPGT